MGGPIILRRLAALMRSCAIQAAPARNLNRGVSADQALRSYKWLYIRLAARLSRWQNLWSYWAIAVVLTLLGRTILLLKPAENKAIFPFCAPRVVQLVTSKIGSINFCHPMVQNFERIPFPISLTNPRSFPTAQLINDI